MMHGFKVSAVQHEEQERDQISRFAAEYKSVTIF